jgi:hypothetical protein
MGLTSMRRIEIADGLSVRFPKRSDEFVEGVEIGLLAAALAGGPARHLMDVSPVTVEQATAFARSLGYRVVTGPARDGLVALTFMRGDVRPRFQVVASAAG